MMHDIYLNELGVVCALGEGKHAVRSALLAPSPASPAARMTLPQGGSHPCAPVSAPLADISALPPGQQSRNNALLLEKMQGERNRRCWYTCVLVLVRHADDPHPLIVDAVWLGEVAEAASGEGGFGYDPLVQIPAYGCSVAQMPAEEKNRVSHRGQAMQALLARLTAFA